MPEDNQPKPSSWEEEIFESIDPGAEEKKREFLKQVHSTLDKGGKVLIPVFALGRA